MIGRIVSHYRILEPLGAGGMARTLAAILALIQQGHLQVVNRQYLNACDTFKVATQKALSLR